MIHNTICAYCRKPFIKEENHPQARSVEHLIPNAMTNRKRKNDEGDFYICRQCNSAKSDIDEILGKCAKMQRDADIAVEVVEKEREENSHLYKKLVKSIKFNEHGPYLTFPIPGNDLVEYMWFLGKGQFLIETGKLYDPDKYVMQLKWYNKIITKSFEENYRTQFESNCFEDLKKNPLAKLINEGECIIHIQNKFSYGYFLHNYIAIGIDILNNSRKNKKTANASRIRILKDFNKKRKRK